MEIIFNENCIEDNSIIDNVAAFLDKVSTIEKVRGIPIIIFQDGVNGAYYIKCSLSAKEIATICDLDARLDLNNPESFRANRELMLKNKTYLKMEEDASKGREFNDVIVEYNTDYNPSLPLKVWGGQHRVSAIKKKGGDPNRYHGFRIYFNLSPLQRTEVALISNTNISVSNDTFDRMIEETTFGERLRKWCQLAGFLDANEDFPDVGSRSDKITVKLARSFIVNFYFGKEKGQYIKTEDLDKNVYQPIAVITGTSIDPKYAQIMNELDILKHIELIEAGKQFVTLHKVQYARITHAGGKLNRKAFRNKAFVESILCGWAFVAGLLQQHEERLRCHYLLPKTTSKIPDPLNAKEMSEFKHDNDPPTYRGLGTRSSPKDMQRIAQLFLAKSLDENVLIDAKFMQKVVNRVVGILYNSQGY